MSNPLVSFCTMERYFETHVFPPSLRSPTPGCSKPTSRPSIEAKTPSQCTLISVAEFPPSLHLPIAACSGIPHSVCSQQIPTMVSTVVKRLQIYISIYDVRNSRSFFFHTIDVNVAGLFFLKRLILRMNFFLLIFTFPKLIPVLKVWKRPFILLRQRPHHPPKAPLLSLNFKKRSGLWSGNSMRVFQVSSFEFMKQFSWIF